MTSDAEAQRRRRDRRWLATTLGGGGAKLAQVAVLVVSVPLLAPLLGPERFGVWSTLANIFALLAVCDAGVGNALMARLARAEGGGDSGAARAAVSNALAAMLLLAGGFALLLAAAWVTLPWAVVLNLHDPVIVSEAASAVGVLAAAFVIGLPLSVPNRIRQGRQEGWVAACFDGGGALLIVAALALAVSWHGNLVAVACAVALPPLAVQALHAALLVRNPELRPARALVRRDELHGLFSAGLLLFVLQVVPTAMFAIDSLIATQLGGQQAAAELAVAQRLAILPNLAVGLALAPLWAAYAEASARGDAAWVRRTWCRSLLATIVAASAGALVIGIAGPQLGSWWSRGTVDLAPALAWGQGLWLYLGMVGGAVAMLLNGLGELRFQVRCAAWFVVVALALKAAFAPMLGVAGLPLATVAAGCCCILAPGIIRGWRLVAVHR